MTVCERIDTILKDRGMSRRKLAIKAGIAPSSFQSAMARNTSLSLDMLIPISDVLGISVEYLHMGIENYQPDITDAELQSMVDSGYADSEDQTTYQELTYLLLKLNELGQQKVIERVEELLELPKYRSEWRGIEDVVLQDHD